MTVGILMLAAGKAERFGSDKRLARLPAGGFLLQHSIDNARASGFELRVCVGASDTKLMAQLDATGVCHIACTQSHLGMGHTLAQGVSQIPPWDGLLVALGDMPYLRPKTFVAVAGALLPGAICVPRFNGIAGHPVGFSAEYFRHLRQLSGDSGARDILAKNSDSVLSLVLDDPGICRDIDYPADLI